MIILSPYYDRNIICICESYIYQLEHIQNSSVLIQDVDLKTNWEQWMIETGGGRGSGRSVQVARQLIGLVWFYSIGGHLISNPVYKSSSSSCRAASTDISDPLSPPLPIVHRLWPVFWATSRILTQLLYVCSS